MTTTTTSTTEDDIEGAINLLKFAAAVACNSFNKKYNIRHFDMNETANF
jgi:hypothetical protein